MGGEFHLSLNVFNNQSESSWIETVAASDSALRHLRSQSVFHLTEYPGWYWVQDVQLPGNCHVYAL